MGEEFSLSMLDQFLKEEQEKIQNDQVSLVLRRQPTVTSNQSPNPTQTLHHNEMPNVGKNKNQLASTLGVQSNGSRMVRSVTRNQLGLNSREVEKDKLISILSKPQTSQTVSKKKPINKVDPLQTIKNKNCTPNDREKEKDRLAEIFASSGYQYQKSSNYQISKNLNSEIGIKSNKETFESTDTKNKDSNRAFDQYEKNYETKNKKPTEQDKIGRGSQNHNIPSIVVSEFDGIDKTSTGPEEKTMVRIGEYSPLNPNVPPSRPQLGIGEYDERRRLVLQQRKQDYDQYLHQMQESFSSSQHENLINTNCQHRDMATQTEWEVEIIPNVSDPTRLSPRPYSAIAPTAERSQQHCASTTTRLSPLPRCFDGLSEKEIKENMYREELRKQIEEKNRLKEEEREKEEEEEAKIDAKIQKDIEKMKRQFEEERFQRLELAIRKKEQDDLLRQRLAFERKSFQDQRKQLLINKSTSPREPSTRQPVGAKFTERQRVKPLHHPPSISCSSKALNDVHEALRQPLLEIQDQFPSRTVTSESNSALDRCLTVKPSTSSRHSRKAKGVDMLVHKTVFEPTEVSFSQQARDTSLLSPSSRVNEDPSPSLYPSRVNEKIREVNDMLKRPLLTESFQTLPPMSPPLLHASVPPLPSASPPLPASRRVQRLDSELLEERWKVPNTERHNAAPSDVFTRHNGSVLTQLGAFRRHLAQERLRMQQRVRDESP